MSEITSFKHLLESLTKITPATKDLKNSCREYFRKNIANFTQEEILCVYDFPHLDNERNNVARSIASKVKDNVPVNAQLLLKVLSEDIKNFNLQELRDQAFNKGLLDNLGAGASNDLKDYILNKSIKKQIKNNRLLDNDTLQKMIDINSKRLDDYVQVAKSHSHIEQLTMIFEHNSQYALNLTYYSHEKLNEALTDLFMKYAPDSIERHMSILEEGRLVQYISKNAQQIDFESRLFIRLNSGTIERLGEVIADQFLKNPDPIKALNYLESLGDSFFDNIKGRYDFKSLLSEPATIDLKSELTRSQTGGEYQIDNIVSKELHVNRLQDFVLNPNNIKVNYNSLVREHIEIFNQPVTEKLNSLSYEKEILDYAFINGKNMVLYSLQNSLDLLSDYQHQRAAFMLLNDFYKRENESVLDLLDNVPQDKLVIYKEANMLIAPQNNSQVNAKILDLQLEQKADTKKMKI